MLLHQPMPATTCTELCYLSHFYSCLMELFGDDPKDLKPRHTLPTLTRGPSGVSLKRRKVKGSFVANKTTGENETH